MKSFRRDILSTTLLMAAVSLHGCGEDGREYSDGSGASATDERSSSANATRGMSAGFVRETYIKPSNSNLADFFGWSIALDGDTLAAGAYGEASLGTGVDVDPGNNFGFNSGAAYVFIRGNGRWSQQAYIKPSNTGIGDTFGTSIALDDDTLAVGAYGEDSDATGIDGDQINDDTAGSGAVYVFVRRGGLWSQQAYLKAANTGVYDRFGYSIALSGDTLAVGAINEDSAATGIDGDADDNSSPDSGAVYVFQRRGDVWSQQAYLKAANSEAGDRFGYSVALDGDILVIGAIGEDGGVSAINGRPDDNSATDSGAVYVFQRRGDVWSQQAYVKAANADAGDRFGRSVALDGELLVVGASDEDSGATGIGGDYSDNSAADSGAVYLFHHSNGGWSQRHYLKASNSAAADYFGRGVAVAGGIIAVGAYGEDSSARGIDDGAGDDDASDSGAVYLFRRDEETGWSQRHYFKASNSDPADYFGWSVAVADETLAVGAMLEDSSATGIDSDAAADNSAPESGAVYVFDRGDDR